MSPKPDADLFSFETSWRTRFTEIDLQGVVHHSEIIKYLEIARIEYWRQTGIGYKELRQAGYEFVVANVECDYLKPLLFDKIIQAKARVCRCSRASMTFEYLIYDDNNKLAVHATTLLVCVKIGEDKPHALPAVYLRRIVDFEKPGSIEIKIRKQGDIADG